jgi:hypothetical protein
MVADLSPILFIGAAFLIPIGFVLSATMRRREYCGEDFRSCFFCERDCTFHRLDKVSFEAADPGEKGVVRRTNRLPGLKPRKPVR